MRVDITYKIKNIFRICAQKFPAYFLLFPFLFFLTLPHLFAQQENSQPLIKHTPISSFIHGEIIRITATLNQEAEWVRFFYRYGMKEFQVRNMDKTENKTYVYDFDTSIVPGLELEYYLAVQTDGKTISFPLNAPQELLKVTGTSKEPMPEIPEELPTPTEEEKKFRLPLSINGNIQSQIVEKEVVQDQKKTQASGNVRIYHNFSKKDINADFDSNFNYMNAPLEGEKSFDLSNMIVSVSRANHSLNVGDININESEFSVSGLGRRGFDYTFNNDKVYFHFFDVSSQQLIGFKGYGVPKSNTYILGGALGYNFFNNMLSLKAIYLTGNDDPSQGANVGFSQLFQTREGNVIALVKEGRFFNERLNLKAEFARSNFDSNLKDQLEAVSDNAYRMGGDFSCGTTTVITLRANYQHIGKDFNSIGYQFITNNRKGYEANIGFNYKGLNLSTVYSHSEDNVSKDPSLSTTGFNDFGGNMALNVVEGKVFINLGYRRNTQETSQGEMASLLQDSLSNTYSGNIGFNVSQSANLNISVTNSDLSSENNPYSNSSNMTVNLAGSLRKGESIFISPSLGYSKMRNKYTNEDTSTYSSFLTGEITFIPHVCSLNLSGSFSRMQDPASIISNTLSADCGLNIYLDNLIKIGRLALALRGRYSYSERGGVTNSDYGVLLNCDFSFDFGQE